MSCGLSVSLHAEQTLTALLEDADIALYCAKSEAQPSQARRPIHAGKGVVERDPRCLSFLHSWASGWRGGGRPFRVDAVEKVVATAVRAGGLLPHGVDNPNSFCAVPWP